MLRLDGIGPLRSYRVLFVTSQWPTASNPHHSPYLVSKVKSLRQSGVEVDVYHYRGQWNPLYYIQAVGGLWKRIGQTPYDLVYAFFGQCGLVATSQRRLPVVVRFGGSDLIGWHDQQGREPFASMILRTVSRLAARRADMVMIPEPGMAVYLPRCEYIAFPDGIDLELFQPCDRMKARRELGFPEGKKLVLFAADPSRVVKRYELARAAVEIAGQKHSVELVVAGSEPHERMPLYMNACDVLVLTSQHEGSPNVVKEALACNLPIVSVDVGDVRSRIGSAPNCVVCETDDPNEIADALNRILQHGNKSNLRDWVLDLDMRRVAQREIEVFAMAVAMKK